MTIDKTLYDRLGGKETYAKVHKIFYDKVFAHPWLGQFFSDSTQEVLESQQTDFMAQLMGGPKMYAGRTPKVAHTHMMITEELFNLRSQLLSDSIRETGVADDLREEWLKADATFKRAIVKTSENECTRAYAGQPILNYLKRAS